MKFFFLASSIIVMSACKSPNGNMGEQNKEKRIVECKLSDHLNSDRISDFAKDVYYGRITKVVDDENGMLLLKHLDTTENVLLPFYVKVLLLSADQADGAYAEALSATVKEFTLAYPSEFAHVFQDSSCFSKHDLKTWSKLISMELEIESENQESSEFKKQMIHEMNSKCSNCSRDQLAVIKRLGDQMLLAQ